MAFGDGGEVDRRRLGWPDARERDEAVSFGSLPWYSVFFLFLLGFHDEYSEKTLSLFALIVCSLAFSSSSVCSNA